MKHVRAYDQTFEDRDHSIKPKYQTKPPFIMTTKGYREDGADEGDHGTEGRDDLQESSEDCPEGREWNADQFEADQPEDTYDEGV